MKDSIKMKAPSGGFSYAKHIMHAERMIEMFGYELADKRYVQQGKQIVIKPKKED